MRWELALLVAAVPASRAWTVRRDDVAQVPREWEVECAKSERAFAGCSPLQCKRILEDDFVSAEQAKHLISIAEKGIALRAPAAGPTIVDINTGFVRDMNGVVNMYRGKGALSFSDEDYGVYRTTIDRIRRRIIRHFSLKNLYFTAPTFITRLVGDETWSPKSIHDEYWHVHVDRNNTPHYDYSGLLYLNDHGHDFTGGEFYFYDEAPNEGKEVPSDTLHLVEPRRGRVLAFSSGTENTHRVAKVQTGVRYLVAMWFTCDPKREFTAFLDGRPHDRFQRSGKAAERQPPRKRRRGKRRPKPLPAKDEL